MSRGMSLGRVRLFVAEPVADGRKWEGDRVGGGGGGGGCGGVLQCTITVCAGQHIFPVQDPCRYLKTHDATDNLHIDSAASPDLQKNI